MNTVTTTKDVMLSLSFGLGTCLRIGCSFYSMYIFLITRLSSGKVGEVQDQEVAVDKLKRGCNGHDLGVISQKIEMTNYHLHFFLVHLYGHLQLLTCGPIEAAMRSSR